MSPRPTSEQRPGDEGLVPGSPVPVPMPAGRLSTDGIARWLLSAVPPEAERVPHVRRQASAVLRLWGLDELTWSVELLVDELAGNAVRHARTPFSVALAWDRRTLRCEVTDVNPVPPQPRPAARLDEPGGRGLILVSQIADRWGFEGHRRGKTIWFELALVTADQSC